MTGHAVNPATTGRDGVDVDLHHVAVRIEFFQQVEGLLVRVLVAKLRGDHRAVDHEVVDVTGGEIVVVLVEFGLAWFQRWRHGVDLQRTSVSVGGPF